MVSPKSLVKTIVFATAIALGVSACTRTAEQKETSYTLNKTYKLTVIYTNGFPVSSAASAKAKARLVNSIRAEAKNDQRHLILISGGTESPESPAGLIPYLDALNYDALVVNSHMFNRPLPYIRELEQSSSTPFISANLFASETGRPLFDGFTLIAADDLNIAVVGVTSNEVREENRKHLSGLDIITSPNSKSTNFIEKLKKQTDIVIAATDCGDTSQATWQGQIASYPDIDLVVGEQQNYPKEKTFSGHGCNEWVTRIDLEFRNGKIRETLREKLMVLNLNSSAPNT